MKPKHQIAAFTATYRQILTKAKGGLQREDIFERMKPAIIAYIEENKEVSAWQMFLQVEARLGNTDSILDADSEQFTFRNFNPECILQLGGGERVLGRFCDRLQLEAHRGQIITNLDAVTEKAQKTITVIDDLLSRMSEGDRVEDILE